jgi:2-iminobutanoate/2-iminopropanoate deaminase
MKPRVETLTLPNTPKPIGPYSHIAKVGSHITIGGTAGTDRRAPSLPCAICRSPTFC